MKRIYEQMLEIVVRNPNLLIKHPEDLIERDRNKLMKVIEGEKWVWLVSENVTYLTIVSDSIREYTWNCMPQYEKNGTCEWGFPYALQHVKFHQTKAFVITVSHTNNYGEPSGTVEEVSHDDALRLLVCDRCLTYWQEKYPEHPMHLDLHRLKQPA